MANDIHDLWMRFIDKHIEAHPDNFAQLNAGATESDFINFKNVTNLDFPASLKPIYELHNGQNDGQGVFFGLGFLSINEIIDQWKSWYEIHQQELDGSLENMSEFCTSFPPQAIKIAYTNPKWIPISYDYGGNHIGIDLDPDIAGTVGQVINFGRDEEAKVVFGNSLQEFLEYCLNIYKTESLFKTIEQTHFIDYLKKDFAEKNVQ